jgi:hypothetical protein
VVGEVTALEHELGDDAVEARAGVACRAGDAQAEVSFAASLVVRRSGQGRRTEAVLAGAELAEVAGRLGDDVVVELELDAAGGRAVD